MGPHFRKMTCSEKSSIPTSKDDSLVDLSIFERNSVFLVPSLTNFMPRFALATPRFARSPQVGFALHEILRSGTKKTEFPPQKNKSPSFSSLLVGKELFLTPLALEFYTSLRLASPYSASLRSDALYKIP